MIAIYFLSVFIPFDIFSLSFLAILDKDSKDPQAFDTLKKGQLVKFNGFFRADEWEDKEGKKQNRIVFVSTSWEKIEYAKKEAE